MENELLKIFAAFTFAFIIVYLAIPTINRVSRLAQWLDKPSERKIHKYPVSRLGGVGIFAALSIVVLFFVSQREFEALNYFIISVIVLFFIGVKDDILVTAPLTKFGGQFAAVFILVVFGHIQITNLHGFFHIREIPSWIGIPLTIFTILVIINAFNFVDGIDGLAATLAIEALVTFGYWFYRREIYHLAIIAFVLTGALLAYLRYNLSSSDNKIFMGDTGTMLIGITLGLLAVEFNQYALNFDDLKYFPAPAVSFGIMIIPFYDMLRIIYIRTLTGHKFFQPDTNHIHHVFIRLGFSHRKTLIILSTLNLLFILLSFELAKFFTIRRLLLIQLLLIGFIIYLPARALRKKEN